MVTTRREHTLSLSLSLSSHTHTHLQTRRRARAHAESEMVGWVCVCALYRAGIERDGGTRAQREYTHTHTILTVFTNRTHTHIGARAHRAHLNNALVHRSLPSGAGYTLVVVVAQHPHRSEDKRHGMLLLLLRLRPIELTLWCCSSLFSAAAPTAAAAAAALLCVCVRAHMLSSLCSVSLLLESTTPLYRNTERHRHTTHGETNMATNSLIC